MAAENKRKQFEAFMSQVNPTATCPVSLSHLASLANSQEPQIICGLTVRKYVKDYYNRGMLQLRKFGNHYVIVGWSNLKTEGEHGQA